MRISVLKGLALCGVVAMTAACDNDTGTGGFSGGVGTTTVTATGRITGTGSIFVDGIEYATDSASVTVSEQAAAAPALKQGMVVTVTGERTGSSQGTASSVVYDAVIKGPVTAPSSIDDETTLLTIAGIEIAVDENTTVLENTTFSSLATNDILEASGYTDASGRLQATYVEKLGTFTSGNVAVEVSGTVSNHSPGTSFELNGLTVNYQPLSTDLPVAGIANGDEVEVEGDINFATPNLIKATEIELEDPRLPTGTQSVELEGIVTAFTGLADFEVSGLAVNAGGGTVQFRPASLAGSLGTGDRVEIEGTVSGSTLVANEVATTEGDIEIEAFVSTVGSTSITLPVSSSGNVEVTVDNRTQFDDETGAATTTFALSEVTAGNFLQVEAYQSTGGDLVATHIKRTAAGSLIELQGPVTSFDDVARTVEILGVSFTAASGSTTFLDGTTAITEATFYNGLAADTIVRVEDTLSSSTVGDGVAEEAGLEN